MLSNRIFFALFALCVLAPFSAFADARCVLNLVESIDSNRMKEILIYANNLDSSGADAGKTWVSNDGKFKLEIKKLLAESARGEFQMNVLVNDATVLRTASQSTGSFIGNQTSVLLADGRALALSCIAQPSVGSP
jgi:hypothetical protein